MGYDTRVIKCQPTPHEIIAIIYYLPSISRKVWLFPELLRASTEHRKWQGPFRSNGTTQGAQNVDHVNSGVAVEVKRCKIQHSLAERQD